MPVFELIVAEFKGENTAEATINKPEIRAMIDEGVIAVVNLALLRKDLQGRFSFKESQDVGGARGALAGAIAGGLIGLLGGPAGALVGALAGAVTGGVAANAIDMGFLNEDLTEFGKDMPNDSSAIVALVEIVWVERLRAALATLGAEVVAYALSEAAQKKLEAMGGAEDTGEVGEKSPES